MARVARVSAHTAHGSMRPTANSRPKAPAAGKPKTFNFASRSRVDGILGSDDKKQLLKLKDEVVKRLPKASKPGNWDSDVVGGEPSLQVLRCGFIADAALRQV